MQELINKVISEAGLTESQAKKAIECTSDYIKDRLPSILRNQIDPILNGKTWDDSIRNQANEFGEDMRNKADSLAGDIRDAFEKAFRKKS